MVTLKLLITGIVAFYPVVEGGTWKEVVFMLPDASAPATTNNGGVIVPKHRPLLWFESADAPQCSQPPGPKCVQPTTLYQSQDCMADPSGGTLTPVFRLWDFFDQEITVTPGGKAPLAEGIQPVSCSPSPPKPDPNVDCDRGTFGPGTTTLHDLKWVLRLDDTVPTSERANVGPPENCFLHGKRCPGLAGRLRVNAGQVRSMGVITDRSGSAVLWQHGIVGSGSAAPPDVYLASGIEVIIEYPRASTVSIHSQALDDSSPAPEVLLLQPAQSNTVTVVIENTNIEELIHYGCVTGPMPQLSHAEMMYKLTKGVSIAGMYVPHKKLTTGVVRIDPPACPPVYGYRK